MSYRDCFHGTELCDQCLELLSDGIKQGAEEERERIIALLETDLCAAYGENCDDNPGCTARNHIIALIKKGHE